jgi:hypothetical protein
MYTGCMSRPEEDGGRALFVIIRVDVESLLDISSS